MHFDDSTAISPAPFVEVELVYEAPTIDVSGRGWCALRIHTKNRIYDVDWSMRCFRVTDARTQLEAPEHRLLGAVLTGGELRDGETFELTYPLPRPGVAAVFEITGERPDYVTTSKVVRVVLRMRVLSVAEESSSPKWKKLSSSFRGVGPGGTQPGHGGEPIPR